MSRQPTPKLGTERRGTHPLCWILGHARRVRPDASGDWYSFECTRCVRPVRYSTPWARLLWWRRQGEPERWPYVKVEGMLDDAQLLVARRELEATGDRLFDRSAAKEVAERLELFGSTRTFIRDPVTGAHALAGEDPGWTPLLGDPPEKAVLTDADTGEVLAVIEPLGAQYQTRGGTKDVYDGEEE